MQVQLPTDTPLHQQQDKQQHNQKQQQRWWQQQSSKQQQQQHPEVLDLLLKGKPLMCLAFSDMVVSKKY